MNLKATLPAGMLALGIATSVHAAPSIDFAIKGDSVPTHSSMRCVATHLDGTAYIATSRHVDNVTTIPLAELLTGDPGIYKTECTISFEGREERYTAKLDTVKLKRGDPRNEAPEYDENGFGYGVRVPLQQTRSRCYDANTRRLDQECLSNYYGNGRYFVEAYMGALLVTFNENREYSSNVGIYLETNPRYLEGKIQPKAVKKAASVASPFQSAQSSQ